MQQALKRFQYVAEQEIAMALFLALKLEKPLLVEGEPGCGKTELAKVLSFISDTDLIRLQCYEGLDANAAIYEWDYVRQLLAIRLSESKKDTRALETEIFSERYLLKRPLLQALLHKGGRPPVLLIDELDRADEEFEGFLLEFLAEFQVTVPELGTLRASQQPHVIITSNRTRELGDGIRRRCLYLYISYPNFERELEIVRLKVPDLDASISRQLVRFVQKVRGLEGVQRRPGVSETLDWANALRSFGAPELDAKSVSETLSCLVKSAEDKQVLSEAVIRDLVASILEEAHGI